MRHYRRRSMGPRTVIQTYKKVINEAPTSRAAGASINHVLSNGVDSLAQGQTGPSDALVATGSVITNFNINYCTMNLADTVCFLHFSVQQLRSGQANTINPNVVGGNPQRNQVFFQALRSVGPNQNMNIAINFKIPKKYQRVREGDFWFVTILGTAIHTDTIQTIYKTLR